MLERIICQNHGRTIKKFILFPQADLPSLENHEVQVQVKACGLSLTSEKVLQQYLIQLLGLFVHQYSNTFVYTCYVYT